MNEESVARLEGMMRDAKFSSEKVQKEFNQLNEKVQKLHHDLEEQIHTNTQLLAENSQKQVGKRERERGRERERKLSQGVYASVKCSFSRTAVSLISQC